ncbi:MAG: hypothetical protein PWQ42_286 [Sulfurospirillum sp.]|nr:hypothetical protein [Sulfurospirillum sp.]
MKKLYMLILFLFAIVLLILLVFYNRYSFAYEEEKSHDYISKNIDILEENLNLEKQYALALSLMISKNKAIQNALVSNNQQLALYEIHKVLNDIKTSTKIDNIDIQIHTKDTRAFARNWDTSDYFGVKLDAFRKGLLRVKETKEPFVSVELGKRLNIKAISPIFDEERNFIGSIEVIMDFKNIKQRLKKFNLSMIALLDKKYIDIAVDLKEHKQLGNYFVVEKNYSQGLFEKLEKNSKILLKKRFFYKIDDDVIALVPMKSLGIEEVGVIALAIGSVDKAVYTYSLDELTLENSEYIYNANNREVIIK